MSIIKRFFKLFTKVKSNKDQNKLESKFTIAHYPITGRFYPKYKNKYIHKQSFSGLYDIWEWDTIEVATYSESEQGAMEIIRVFKEQYLKVGTKTIKVN
jgi:hypothetical protein